MNSIIKKALFVFTLLAVVVGCNEEDSLRDTTVTSVKSLYEPTEGKSVILQSSASASLFFEWEPARAEDSGMVLYEVVFDEEGGDFSAPIYKMASDNNGGYNNTTITHKQLNKIAGMAGIGSGETGRVIWTVFSSKGINEMKGEESRVLEITRLTGFEEVPVDVYVTGEGSEGGSDLANAVHMKATAPGEFEIYTKLTSGQSYHFVDAISGSPRTFYIDGEIIKEGSTTNTIDETGIYRIKLDFNVGSAVYTQITDLQLYFCPTNSFLFSLDYIGFGEWKASSQPVTFKQESWGRDERYKFMMTTIDSDGETVKEWWGTKNSTDGPPSGADSYYHLAQVPESQWDDKFKFASEMDMALVDVAVYFQADNEYTHNVVKVGDQ
ncbi:MAG: SusE domain-containing protein [Cytophagales bacterium]|nr:SusE domain-containing protein [Cytophagales bacterium]